MSVNFWDQEKKKDKKFENDLNKDWDALHQNDAEELKCSKECVNNAGGICIKNDWSCSLKNE